MADAMRRIALAATFLCVSMPPAASQMLDRCADLWFTRGQLLDRAGYCVEGELAGRLFDNSQCSHLPVTLSEMHQRILEVAHANAEAIGCDIESGSGYPPLTRFDLRRELEHIPVPAVSIAECLMWTGETVYLYAGPSSGAAVIGSAGYYDDIFREYDTPGAPDGWWFATVYSDGEQLALGWTNNQIDPDFCGN